MKKTLNRTLTQSLLTAVCLTTIALPVAAGGPWKDRPGHDKNHPVHGQYGSYERTAYAKVTQVEPIYQTISRDVPERSCHLETRYIQESRHQSYTPAILGTIIGGAIGNEVGHSNTNKKVGTVVGGVLGATLARDWSNSRQSGEERSRPVREEVCEVNYRTEYEEQIVGYNVTYRYDGERYQTRTEHHPGKRIQVAVSVKPLYR